jgi:3(or 17)beta-hydroxysteroid dehydrogenase
MSKLQDKVALVTGGASGIGRAIATRLAADGAQVFITDVQGALGRETAAAGGFEFLEQDVANEDLWPQVIAAVEGRFGKLDILVNNAGILGPVDATPETATLTDWRRIFSVNLEGTFLGCRAAIPAMKKVGGGAIVNISSVTSEMATNQSLAYGASKAAVRQLTKSVATHCAKLNIRCNSVHPGFTETPTLLQGYADIAKRVGASVEQIAASRQGQHPARRLHPGRGHRRRRRLPRLRRRAPCDGRQADRSTAAC